MHGHHIIRYQFLGNDNRPVDFVGELVAQRPLTQAQQVGRADDRGLVIGRLAGKTLARMNILIHHGDEC